MIATAFFVNVTVDDTNPEDYISNATTLIDAMHKITGNNLSEFTKPHMSNPWCDVQASIDETNTINLAIVLLGWSTKAWTLDKNKLTSLLRVEVPAMNIKVTKRSVDKNELARIIAKERELTMIATDEVHDQKEESSN
jgi:hypothetical protein